MFSIEKNRNGRLADVDVEMENDVAHFCSERNVRAPQGDRTNGLTFPPHVVP